MRQPPCGGRRMKCALRNARCGSCVCVLLGCCVGADWVLLGCCLGVAWMLGCRLDARVPLKR
eukprot:11169614-Lingulodinium_polyedra.AAC.1